MKAIINRGALLNVLETIAPACLSRGPKPVLMCVHLEATTSAFAARTTDLELCISTSTGQVQTEMVGATLVDFARFHAIVRELSSDTITLRMEKDNLIVVAGSSKFTLPTMDVKDFPPAPTIEGETKVSIPATALRRGIDATAYAMADVQTRYSFNGLNLVGDGKNIIAVATESHILAKCIACNGTKEKFSCIVPRKAVEALRKILDTEEEEATAELSVAENRISCVFGDVMLSTNLLEGSFPPYEDSIPKEHECRATVSTVELISAIRQAALVATDTNTEYGGQALAITFSSEGIRIVGRSPEKGECDITVPCKVKGKSLTIGLNGRMLSDTLRHAEADEISIFLTKPNRPIRLETGKDIINVQMPVNLQ